MPQRGVSNHRFASFHAISQNFVSLAIVRISRSACYGWQNHHNCGSPEHCWRSSVRIPLDSADVGCWDNRLFIKITRHKIDHSFATGLIFTIKCMPLEHLYNSIMRVKGFVKHTNLWRRFFLLLCLCSESRLSKYQIDRFDRSSALRFPAVRHGATKTALGGELAKNASILMPYRTVHRLKWRLCRSINK